MKFEGTYTKSSLRETIGAAIREARLRKRMSQAELASQCGIDQANISKIEAGKYNSTLDIIEKICSVLFINLKVVELNAD